MSCSRREFLKLVQVGVGGSALLSVLPGCDSAGGAAVEGSVTVTGGKAVLTFAQFPQLAAAGGGVVVSAGGVPIAVLRTGTSAAIALSAICTHQGCTVAYQGGSLNCPCHGSRFSSTGAVLGGPASSPLPALTATLNAADITVTGL
jgi:Rieske Fe-S protein